MATPLTASKLVEILKAEGVKVLTPHSGWATHERDSATGKTFGPVHGVLMHHTAGHNVGDYVYNGSSALPGPLCHGYIRKDGAVEMCSAGRANHAGGGDPTVLTEVINESYGTKPSATHYHEGSSGAADGNDPFYGYECENLGDGNDPWPAVQYTAMVKAATAICRYYGWSEKSVIGHLEWSDWKSDPRGFTMASFRADVKAALALPAGKWNAGITDTGGSTVALTSADIDAVAKRVLTMDGVIEAQPEPYNNSDYATNKFWGMKYTLYTIVRSAREAVARIKNVETKVDALSTPTVDLDALATKIVAQLGDDLADKVADKLAQRLQS